MNRARPISVTFAKYDDKENIMQNKRNLPGGIYINDEYSAEVKRNRDKLRPIFRLAKGLPHYCDKCKLSGDCLTINGTTYTVDDINKLPKLIWPPILQRKRKMQNTLLFMGN